MPLRKKRKICFPIMNRVHYARQLHLLNLLKRDPAFDLQVVVGGSALLEKYGERFLPAMEKSGFEISDALYNVIEGGNHVTMAKTAALTALEFSNSLHKLNPDIVLIRGDRFEQLAIAMVAAYMNKTIAHIEGGDVSGTIDESVRHAITKLSHVHFVTNEDARARVIQMGENPEMVFNVGSPDVEFISLVKKKLDPSRINTIGTGDSINFSKPFIVVIHHPVTTESNNRSHTETLLRAIASLNMQIIWFWPNNDAGTAEMAKAIRIYRETTTTHTAPIKFVTDMLPQDFIALLRRTTCLVGNSSAGIKESSYLGIPVVNIGSRQAGRMKASNVVDVGYEMKDLREAIKKQVGHGPYAPSHLYYQPLSSKKIVGILKKVPLVCQKKFYES